MITVIKPTFVKKFCHAKGKRVSKEFILALDHMVRTKLEHACAKRYWTLKAEDLG